jgi:mycothiol synthase
MIVMTPPVHDLPTGWQAGRPVPSDVAALHDLIVRHETVARGSSGTSLLTVESEIVGKGAGSREQVVVHDGAGAIRAWATVHDRAPGRSLVDVVVDPALEPAPADQVAAALFAWATAVTVAVGTGRGLDQRQVDSGAFADDPRQQRWLTAAGLTHVRSWWQMSRPVDPAEAAPDAFPPPADGVVVRTVARAEGGMPPHLDLAAIHDILETAFTDHFNHHEETFEEFCSRLREDPGHRWDHWWIAELTDAETGSTEPAGALVGAVSPGADGAPDGSYVDYLGVLQSARGRGVATSLLHAVIADAARRGRRTVGIEVDRDSPTGAADLYLSMGFVTAYVTQSWHLDVTMPTT